MWSRTLYVPNKLCALNNDVHLITRFYGIYFYTADIGCMHDLDSAVLYALLRLEAKRQC